MKAEDFMASVLGFDGLVCVATMDQQKKITHYFVDDFKEAGRVVDEVKDEFNVFFAAGRFNKKRRKPEYVTQLRSLFIDLDCGERKPYKSKKDALIALKTFCGETHMPKPSIVDTGNGYHAYWPLNKVMDVQHWVPIAERFKAFCHAHDLDIDNAVTADAARILRMPNTFNLKGEEPKPTTVLTEYEKLLSVEEVLEIIGEPELVNTESESLFPGFSVPEHLRQKSDINKTLIGPTYDFSFRRILARTKKGKGCKQLGIIATQQDSIEEPLWRAGLSIAQSCKDGKKAAHAISAHHPDYTYKETEKKRKEIDNPYTCATFDGLNPGVCETCPHFGKIKSPIVLGKVAPAGERETVSFVDQDGKTIEMNAIKEIRPQLPASYTFGKERGIYRAPLDDDDDPTLISLNDFYALKRVDDPVDGEMVVTRLLLPNDKPREFMLPLTAVASLEKFRDEVAKRGLVCADYNKPRMYMNDCVVQLQDQESAATAARQFGWTDQTMQTFILGERAIQADVVERNYATRPTAALFDCFTPKGSLAEWKKAIEFFNRPGNEVHQYVVARAFGSVLMRLMPQNACGLNIFSQDSGFGKTTAMIGGASVWGNPDTFIIQAKDTQNFLMNRMEVHGDLPAYIDEFSNQSGEVISNFTYDSSSGQQRGRMGRSGNEERYRSKPWHLLWTSTANQSFAEALATYKGRATAEGMRMFNVEVEKITGINSVAKQESDDFLQAVRDNHGHAGPVFVQYVAKHIDAVRQLVKQRQQFYDKHFAIAGPERFWSADVVCTMVGAEIANKIGLIPFKQAGLMKGLGNVLALNRETISGLQEDALSVINDYLLLHWDDVMRVREDNSVFVIAENEARRVLRARYEAKGRNLYIAKNFFKQWCSSKKRNYQLLERELIQNYGAIPCKKRIAAGSKINLPAVACLKIRISEEDAAALQSEDNG